MPFVEFDLPLDAGMRPDASMAMDVVATGGSLRARGGRASVGTPSATATDFYSVGYHPDQAQSIVYGLDGTRKFWTATGTSIPTDPVMGSLYPKGTGGWVQAGDELLSRDGRDNDTNLGILRWGGKTTPAYSTGTVATTAGGTDADYYVTGTGTTWTSAHVGCYIIFQSAQRRRIVDVLSATKLRLDAPAGTAHSGGTYTIVPITVLQAGTPTMSNGQSMFGHAISATGTVADFGLSGVLPFGDAVCYHQGRLFVGGMWEYATDSTTHSKVPRRHRIRWSGLAGDRSYTAGAQGISYFQVNAYLDVNPMGGIIGMASFHGDLVVLCRRGIQVVRGGFASDGTDNGAALSTVFSQGPMSISSWDVGDSGVYFANNNGVFLWDGQSVTEVTKHVRQELRANFWDRATDITVSAFDRRVVVSYWIESVLATRTFQVDTSVPNITWVAAPFTTRLAPVYSSGGSLSQVLGTARSPYDSGTRLLMDWLPAFDENVNGTDGDDDTSGTPVFLVNSTWKKFPQPVSAIEAVVDGYFAPNTTIGIGVFGAYGAELVLGNAQWNGEFSTGSTGYGPWRVALGNSGASGARATGLVARLTEAGSGSGGVITKLLVNVEPDEAFLGA